MTKKLPRPPGFVDAFRRALRWHRRSIAAVAAFVAVFAGITAVQPPADPMVTVVAAARDLSGGTTLAATDLVQIQLPAGSEPSRAVSHPAELVGRVLNGPLSTRSVITGASISRGAELAQPGHVVFGITLPNPALAPLIEPGTRVDVIASRGEVVASDVRVVSAPEPETSMLSGSGQRVLLLEVTPEGAARLASAGDLGGLTVALR